MAEPGDLAAIVLSGGRASRLDHTSKGSVRVGGAALLGRILDVLDDIPTVVVGDDVVPAHVTRTREDPPYSGPAAAIAAGVECIASQNVTAEHVLLLAVDLPFASHAVQQLIGMPIHADGVIAVDPDGRPQYLLSKVRRESLQSALARRSSWSDASVRRLMSTLRLTPLKFDARTVFDIDTWDDLRMARTWIATGDENSHE